MKCHASAGWLGGLALSKATGNHSLASVLQAASPRDSTWHLRGPEILNTRKPSDIVKRSNAQVKKMVTNAEEVEAWFSEWGGPAPLWKMFHDDGTHSFAPVDGTGQQACDHFLDICERKMGLSTCLKLEHFTMGASN